MYRPESDPLAISLESCIFTTIYDLCLTNAASIMYIIDQATGRFLEDNRLMLLKKKEYYI